MTVLKESEQEHFHAWLAQKFDGITPQAAELKKTRQKAWEKYVELGLPTRKTEAYQYVRLRPMLSESFGHASETTVNAETIAKHILPETQQSVLVLVNGMYRPDLSRTADLAKQMVVLPLSDAIRTYGTLLNNQLTRSLKEERDAFVALNAALHCDGLFIYLPPKCVQEVPVQVLHFIDAKVGVPLIMPRVHIFGGNFAEAQFAFTNIATEGSRFAVNCVLELYLEEGTKIKAVQHSNFKNSNGWSLDALRASLKKNSSLHCVNMTHADVATRYDYYVALTGENCEALLHGISKIKGNGEAHNHILIEHQAPHCQSNQLFKNVIDDHARSSFEGKILVRQAAQKTAAYQLNQNLLLNDYALCYSKPNLEIFADDVKASHGATVGQLNEDHLFYMMARGLSKQEAQKLLIDGFCQEVLDLVFVKSLAEAFMNH